MAAQPTASLGERPRTGRESVRERTLRKTAVPDVRAYELGFLLSRVGAAHVLVSESNVHRQHGLSWSAFRVLYFLWIYDRLEARDLVALTAVSRQSISSVLGTLENRGLIERERNAYGDRRLVSVRLSPAGTACIAAAFEGQHEVDRAWFGRLSADEADQLNSLLLKIADAPMALRATDE